MSGRFSLEAYFSGNDRLSGVISKISTNYSRMASNMKGPWQEFSKLNDQVIGKLEGIAKKGLKLGLGLTGIAGAIGFHEIVSEGEETEAAIARLGSVTLRTADQIAELSERARELGANGKFTTAQIAAGMEMLQRADLSDSQVLESINSITTAAKIGGEEVDATAKQIVAAAKAIGTASDEMGSASAHIADLVSAASRHTTASLSELTEGIVAVGPVAKQLKIPLEEVVAANIGLKESGIDAADGISKLFIKLSKPPPKLARELDQWKIKFKDVHGQMLPFATVMENVSKAAKKSGGNFNQVAFLAELVGAKSEKAAIALMEMFDSGRYDTLTKSLQNANGEVREMGKLRGDTIRGDVTKIRARIRDISDAIFDLGKGPLRELTSDTLHWIDANKEIIKTKAAEYVHDFAAALPKIIDRIERLWPLVKVIGEISAAIWVVNKATAAWTALSEMNPWVRGLTLVLIAATALVEYWPEIKKFFDDHQVAIASVGVALAALAVAMYGPQGINVAMNAASIAIGGVKTSAIATQGALAALNGVSFAGLLVSIAAVGAAIGGILLALDQANKLRQETGGLGFFGTVGQMIEQGTWDPAKAVDEYQNDQARRDAANRPEIFAPRSHRSHIDDGADNEGVINENRSVSELIISDESGKAKWKTPPKKGSGIRLARPSGAL